MVDDWYSYPSNYSNGTEVNSTASFFKYINEIPLGGNFAYGFIFLIWVLTFAFSMMLGVRKALMTSSFITFIFSIYFWRLGMINPTIIIVSILLTIIGALGSKEENRI